MRIRKNVNDLKADEKRRLVDAIERLKDNRKYLDLGNIHGAPVNELCTKENAPFSTDGMCCIHNKAPLLFLPWHRLYMAQMEEELGEALPFWDWTVDKDVPDLWEEIRAPMKPPLKSKCDHGQRGGYGNEHEGKGYSNGYGSKGYGTSKAGGHYGDGGGGGYGEGRGYESFVTRKPDIEIDEEKLKGRVERAFKKDNIVDFEKEIRWSLNKERSKKNCYF